MTREQFNNLEKGDTIVWNDGSHRLVLEDREGVYIKMESKYGDKILPYSYYSIKDFVTKVIKY